MARLRKAARIWGNPKAREIGERVLFTPGDSLFTIDPPAMFGRRAPVEIEIGAGKGEFIIERAAEFPARDFIAVELSSTITRVLAVRCGRAGLDNLRVVRMDARTLVNLMLADASVSAFHIYYPDPWPKERHVKHRLFTPTLAASLFRTVEPGAIAYVATDVRDYAVRNFPDDARGGLYPRGRGRARRRAHRLRAQVRRRGQAGLCGLIPPSARVQK